MRKAGVAGVRRPGAGRKAGAGGRICFGPNCGSARKTAGRKRGR